jgi:multiple sugar transport system permease protein
MVLIAVLPFALTAYYATTDLSYTLPGREGSFVGMDNFARSVGDERFFRSLLLTLQFAAVVVPIELALGLAVALAVPAGTRVGRSLLPVIGAPVMLSGIAVGLLWRLLLNGDFGAGVHILRAVGIAQSSSVLGTPRGAFLSIVAADVWQWAPFCALVLLAARVSLPETPFLAARLDGARPWEIVRDVTLPGLKPALLVCLLFRATDCVREFDKVVVMTNGGPGSHTELVSLYLWNVSFVQGDVGYGAAVTIIVYLLVLLGVNLVLFAVRPGAGRYAR